MPERRSFLFFDRTCTHDGSRRLWENWDFVTKMPCLPDVPRNWVEPVNFRDGTFTIDLEVRRMSAVKLPVWFLFGWWNTPGDPEIRHCVVGGIEFSEPGCYARTGPVTSLELWYGAGPKENEACSIWHWDAAFMDNSFYSGLDPRKNVAPTEGFPYEIRVRFTVRAKEG